MAERVIQILDDTKSQSVFFALGAGEKIVFKHLPEPQITNKLWLKDRPPAKKYRQNSFCCSRLCPLSLRISAIAIIYTCSERT